MADDRYQPMPGLLELPGFLVGKLSPRGRKIAAVVAALVVVGGAIGLILGIPAIEASKRAAAAADARATARIRAQRLAVLRREVRPITATGTAAHGLKGAAALRAREALRSEMVAAVLADSLRRVKTGEIPFKPHAVQCSIFPTELGGPDPAKLLSKAHGRYGCLAITANVSRESYTAGSTIGYPYRALVDFPAGRFTFCRIPGRPGEQLIGADVSVTVPLSCGGLRQR